VLTSFLYVILVLLPRSAQQPEAQAEIRWLTATSARLFPTIDLLTG